MYCIEFGHIMQPIQRVAVVGAGNMGSGIAQKSAQEEFDVQMVDRELQWVERGQSIIANFLDEAVERRIFSPAQVEAIQGRITGVVGVENTAENTDLVIEAVFEDMKIKQDVMKALDLAAPDAVLASNTSYLDIDLMAACLADPSRLVGLHFFSPAHIMKLLEIVRGAATSDRSLATGYALAKRLRKIPVEVGVCDGFVGNRMLQRVLSLIHI